MNTETRAAAERDIARFAAKYARKYPKGGGRTDGRPSAPARVLRLSGGTLEALRTTNRIEATFATVRPRGGVTKGAGSRTAGLVMAFKLLQVAQGHGADSTGPSSSPLVRAGVSFKDGTQVEPQPSRKRKTVAA